MKPGHPNLSFSSFDSSIVPAMHMYKSDNSTIDATGSFPFPEEKRYLDSAPRDDVRDALPLQLDFE